MSFRLNAFLLSGSLLTICSGNSAGAAAPAPGTADSQTPSSALASPLPGSQPLELKIPKLNTAAVPIPPTLLPAPVNAGARLTLQQTLDLAYPHNPLVRAADLTVASAASGLKAAKLPLDPSIYMDAGLSPLTNTFSLFPAQDVFIDGVWEISGRHHYRVEAARATLFGARSDDRTARLNMLQNVANAYITLQVANQSLVVQEDLYELTAQQTNLTEQQFKLGAARENDFIRLQIALTQAEQALIQARDGVSVARASLNLVIGRPADTPVDAAETLHVPKVQYTAPQLVTEALSHRPELQSEEAALRNLAVAIKVQRSQYFPDLNIGIRPEGFVPGDNYELLTASITFPLPLGSIRHYIDQAKTNLGAEQARAEQLHDQVTLDVESGRLAVESALKIVQSFETGGILARTADLVERTQKGFEVGGASILDIIDAQNTYRSTLVNYYQAIGNYEAALIQLERAVGAQLAVAASGPALAFSAEPSVPATSPLAPALAPPAAPKPERSGLPAQR